MPASFTKISTIVRNYLILTTLRISFRLQGWFRPTTAVQRAGRLFTLPHPSARRRAMTAVGDRHVDTELARRHGGAVSAQAAAEHEDIGARPFDREAHVHLRTWRHMLMKWVDSFGFSLTAMPL